MSFCKFSSQTIINNKTEIDNIFINDYLPYATDNAVKVYLYGLYKCYNSSSYDNNIESFSKILQLTEEEIMNCFKYWESEGLIQILNTIPVEIKYLPLKNIINNTKKFKLSKYGDFSAKAQEIIEGRMISPNEYNEYFDTIETFHIEPEAFLMIMKYCVNTKGVNIGYPYIVTVAKNWAYDNVRTVAEVEERLISYEKISEDLKLIMKALAIKKIPTIEQKEMFIKWTKELDFKTNVILNIIKINKKPSYNLNFEQLDSLILKYYEMKLFTINDIEEYEKNKINLYNLAKKVTKELGLYYESLDSIVEKYITKWINMGFEENAIIKIAQYCFLNSIRKFEGMNSIVQKFYKLGLLTLISLEKYINQILEEEEKLKDILSIIDSNKVITSFDREFYKNWKYNWNMSNDLIKYAASLSVDKIQPVKYMNGILAKWHEQGIINIDQASNVLKNNNNIKEEDDNKKQYISRTYTKENLNALFDSLEEVEI